MSSPTEPLFDLPEPRRSAVARAQWVLAALDPAQRRHHIERYLGPWVTWLVHTYRLRTAIPPCWYRHPDITERLKNLMVGWIATFTDDPGDHLADRPFAYVEFDDALERELHRITVPPACLDGDHEDPPATWTTDPGQADWLTSSTWATAPPEHPTPDFTGTPTADQPATARTETTMADQPRHPGNPGQTGTGFVMPRAQGEDLIKDGQATPMRDYAIHYDGAWWLGDAQTYVRVTDDELNHKLDFKAIKLARADQAVARAPQAENPTGPGKEPGGDQSTPNQPDTAGELRAAAGDAPPEPHDRPYDQPDDRPDDPGEVPS